MTSPTPEPITAADVVYASIAVRPPCPVCGSMAPCRCARPEGYDPVRAQTDIVIAALTERGMLAHLPWASEDYDDVASWLAEVSGHPRYDGQGWVKVLQSTADVELAASAAIGRAGLPSEIERIVAARSRLLAEVTRRLAEQAPPE